MTDDRSRFHLPSVLKNPISYVGLFIFVAATAVGLPLLFLDLFSKKANPYAGIFIFVILPATAGFGLLVAALGAWRQHHRRHLGAAVFPVINLNEPRQRLVLVGSVAAALVVFVLLSVTGYRAYEFSDSVQFCGEICHEVMKPEYKAYQNSPHARVACVGCHVGPGAGWYVHSKISGAYQIYSVAFKKFPRPIETPVHDLRPAQGTCEQCHWPAKFFGAQQKAFKHFMADEKNSPWEIQTLLKIGGGDPKSNATSGIHWHMNIKNDIFYVATDKQRQVIPWVRAVAKDGKVTEYMSTESPLSPADLAKAEIRKMDCIDCHNRPSHIFHPPDRAIDQAFEAGRMDPSLPYLKREAMRLLAGEYKSEKEAHQAILKELPAFYQEHYPQVYKAKALAVSDATQMVQQLFSSNVFPEMKTDWRSHPNNVGHLIWDGCFRCHDGQHKSQDGKVITNDCNACHTILAQGAPGALTNTPLRAQPFQHPVDLGVDVTTMKCSQCHNGTTGL